VPELPEVETVVRGIRPKLTGLSITGARFLVPRQLQPQTPRVVAKALMGRRIRGVRRRGKIILIELNGGTLLVHLRMTGSLHVRPIGADNGDYERARMTLDNGTILVFRDPRTLGILRFYSDSDTIEPLRRLGWEPLEDEVSAEQVRERLARRKLAIKPLLLDQSLWAGIGNIYASEALWVASVDPRKKASSLTRPEIERLIKSVPRVLRAALHCGGTTLRDFADPNGRRGSYQREFRVYGRQGEPCFRCGRPIRKIVQAQRSTYFCSGCQRRR
jgi:formamidopyrimidine-DNA glycosylase